VTTSYLTPEQVDQLLRPINGKRIAILDGMAHLEAYDVRAHLTRIFGFGRWGEQILAATLLYAQPTQTRAGKDAVKVAYQATVRLSVRAPDGTLLTELDGAAVGESTMPTFKEGDAYDMALKTACSQALKRCAIDLGDQFGLSLYRKGSTDALVGRTLVGSAEQATPGDAVDANAPTVVPETQPAVEGEPPRSGVERLRDAVTPQRAAEAPAAPISNPVGITRSQLTALNAALTQDLQITDRAAKLAYLSEQLGRPIGSSAELLKDEASKLIDRIQRWSEPPPEEPTDLILTEPEDAQA
jgi:hypothetical protein